VATEIFEGERRFPGVVRLPERFRNNIEAISNILITSKSGAQARLADVAKIAVVDGPAQISRELGKRRIVVGVNVKDRDLGSFVAELQQKVGPDQVAGWLLPGVGRSVPEHGARAWAT
jgi:cobalt-zinc-cadmium resistance protein CzcA